MRLILAAIRPERTVGLRRYSSQGLYHRDAFQCKLEAFSTFGRKENVLSDGDIFNKHEAH